MTAQPIRQLAVDLEELCIALEGETADLAWYLDVQTGAVLLVTAEYEAAEHDGLTATEIETDPVRFLRVPPGDPQHEVADMRAFAEHLGNPTLKESLELALSAPRPDRRFKTALSWLPEHQQAWHTYRKERCRQRALSWLGHHGIAPVPFAA